MGSLFAWHFLAFVCTFVFVVTDCLRFGVRFTPDMCTASLIGGLFVWRFLAFCVQIVLVVTSYLRFGVRFEPDMCTYQA